MQADEFALQGRPAGRQALEITGIVARAEQLLLEREQHGFDLLPLRGGVDGWWLNVVIPLNSKYADGSRELARLGEQAGQSRDRVGDVIVRQGDGRSISAASASTALQTDQLGEELRKVGQHRSGC